MDKLPPAVTAAMLQLATAYRRESDVRADAARRIASALQERRAAEDVVHAAVTALADRWDDEWEREVADDGGVVVWDQAGLPLAA